MAPLGWETGTDKVTRHGYHRIYEKYFGEPLRSSAGLKVLEIGLEEGSSMNLWCRYFPTAEIVGVDINLHPDCQPCKLGEGVYVYGGDTRDGELLRRITEKEEEGDRQGGRGKAEESKQFDIIVDDGAHTPHSQIFAFNFLFKHGLADGGVYFIEDVETSYWTKGELFGNVYGGGGLGRGGESGQNIVEVFKKLADEANREFFAERAAEQGDLIGGLDWKAAGMVESVEFGPNIIAVKKKNRKNNEDGSNSRMYYDRAYIFSNNVEGYLRERERESA
jgi:hypothetical protein